MSRSFELSTHGGGMKAAVMSTTLLDKLSHVLLEKKAFHGCSMDMLLENHERRVRSCRRRGLRMR